ncbi:MAG: hypothetical protein K9M57_01675 [Phycisphaerae bacterium]|nr:hypothetical protein [Phycisphaerae bacterium]
MKKTLPCMVMALIALVMLNGCGPSKKLPISEQRQLINEMENETIRRLHRESPETKTEIRTAAGYAVFRNANVNLLFASAGGGYGVAVDNATGKRTYMKMTLGGFGLGLGVKDYRVVMVFRYKNTLETFIEKGWDVGVHADAAAKAGESGAEVSGEGDFRSNIHVYSMTESGLALQATIAGTKYWKNDELN